MKTTLLLIKIATGLVIICICLVVADIIIVLTKLR